MEHIVNDMRHVLKFAQMAFIQSLSIGHWLVAASAYSNDTAMFAPTARAVRSVLAICDEFASE
jgi:hypothetical protein